MTPLTLAQCAVAVLGCLLLVATVSRSRVGLLLCALSSTIITVTVLVLIT